MVDDILKIKSSSFRVEILLMVVVFLLPSIQIVFAASIAFDSASYAYNSFPAKITVLDSDANITPSPDTISITITSDSDPVGITLELIETGDETGEFRNTWLIFMDDNNLFEENTPLLATYDDSNFAGSGTLDIFIVSIFPPNFGIDIRSIIDPLTLTETSPGNFEGTFTLTTTGPGTETALEAAGGDIISASFPCESSNGLVLPNPDSTVGAIIALDGETVTATYEDAANNIIVATALVESGGGGCGGSGGGLVPNPGFVLDVVGGTSGGDYLAPQLIIPKLNLSSLPLIGDILDFLSNADPFTPIAPLDDPDIDYPLSINGNGYLLTQYANTIETYTGKTGEPISLKMTLFDSTGVEHIGLYTNLRGDLREISNSNTYLIYHEGKELEITDPNGFFSNVNFTESEYDGKYFTEFDMTFAKPMDTSDIIIRTWDERLNSGDIKIFDAIKIEGEPMIPDTNNLIVPGSADIVVPYYKMPYYEIPAANSEGNLVYYNSFGGLEERQVHPYYDPIEYPDDIGKDERHDDGFLELVMDETFRVENLVSSSTKELSFQQVENSKMKVYSYPKHIGRLDRENFETITIEIKNEIERANTVFGKLYNTNMIND